VIYAICFDSNAVFEFLSEREAVDYCKRHLGDWQLCDEAGRLVVPAGLAPRMRTELLAVHLWLSAAHEDGALAHAHPVSAPDLIGVPLS
jgi:hypothetical protein